MNLKDIFGEDIDNQSVKTQISQAILDKILDRAANGVDVDGKRFKGYSDAYKNSDEFAAFGKSPNRVNLRLTGDMLELMEVVDETKNTITIGWDDGEEGSKAHGHITGGGNLPRRDFFGLTNKDLEEIKREFQDDIGRDEEVTISEGVILDALRLIRGEG